MKLPEVKDTDIFRIDPELFLEGVLKLNIGYEHLSYDDSILGITVFEEAVIKVLNEADEEEDLLLDGNTVLIESDLKYGVKNKGRMNFTLMHEGGHQILKHLFPDDYGFANGGTPPVLCYKANSENDNKITDWEEWQANAIASATLLPACLIRQGMSFFGFGNKIECLNRVFWPEDFKRFTALADFLGSSRKALAIRMKQLGLLKKEYLDNPYEMISIER